MRGSPYNALHSSPVIILGAARSGTRLVRRLVAATQRYAEIPYDVNYIWRYGNETCPHDALPIDSLTCPIRRFIHERLTTCAGLHASSAAFVEKTVSNTLRVSFVKAVYPDAKYIAVVRDGRDVVESAVRCWRQPPRLGPIVGKLKTFPWLHCAPYAWKYAASLSRRAIGLDQHLRTWGPRYPDIDQDVTRLSLSEVCARQWLASVEHYEQSRHFLSADQLLELKYEDLVREPLFQIGRLCEFLDIDDDRALRKLAQKSIRPDRIGTHTTLSAEDRAKILPILAPSLGRWGYADRPAAQLAA